MFKRVRLWLLWLTWWFAGPALAAQLVVHVVDSNGKPVSDAVVTLTSDSGAFPAKTPPTPRTRYVDQRDETFLPYVQIFRPGDKVVFRNSDTTRHQVYSFSKIRKFELVLRPGESSPPIELDSAGIAAVGCNIHDDMVTYLFVTAAENIVMSDRSGVAQFEHLLPGQYTASIWHPQLHPGQAEPTRSVTVSSDPKAGNLSFTLSLIPDPRGATAHDQPLY